MCSYACVFVPVHVSRCVHVKSMTVAIRGQPQAPVLIFSFQSRVFLCVRRGSYAMIWGFVLLSPRPFPHGSTGTTDLGLTAADFHVNTGDSNSGPHAYVGSSSPISWPSLQLPSPLWSIPRLATDLIATMLLARKPTANLSVISQTAQAEMPLDLSVSCFQLTAHPGPLYQCRDPHYKS